MYTLYKYMTYIHCLFEHFGSDVYIRTEDANTSDPTSDPRVATGLLYPMGWLGCDVFGSVCIMYMSISGLIYTSDPMHIYM